MIVPSCPVNGLVGSYNRVLRWSLESSERFCSRRMVRTCAGPFAGTNHPAATGTISKPDWVPLVRSDDRAELPSAWPGRFKHWMRLHNPSAFPVAPWGHSFTVGGFEMVSVAAGWFVPANSSAQVRTILRLQSKMIDCRLAGDL